jgi:hypothetical protein
MPELLASVVTTKGLLVSGIRRTGAVVKAFLTDRKAVSCAYPQRKAFLSPLVASVSGATMEEKFLMNRR